MATSNDPFVITIFVQCPVQSTKANSQKTDSCWYDYNDYSDYDCPYSTACVTLRTDAQFLKIGVRDTFAVVKTPLMWFYLISATGETLRCNITSQDGIYDGW